MRTAAHRMDARAVSDGRRTARPRNPVASSACRAGRVSGAFDGYAGVLGEHGTGSCVDRSPRRRTAVWIEVSYRDVLARVQRHRGRAACAQAVGRAADSHSFREQHRALHAGSRSDVGRSAVLPGVTRVLAGLAGPRQIAVRDEPVDARPGCSVRHARVRARAGGCTGRCRDRRRCRHSGVDR